jgi:hypothetical protein
LTTLRPYIEEMGAFYEIAMKRDEAFISNFIEGANRKDKNLIMVTGGFHTEGVARGLKEKKMPYVVIAPRVTAHTEKDIKTYYTLLRGEVPFTYEEMLMAQKLALSSLLGNNEFLTRVVLFGLSKLGAFKEGTKIQKFITNWSTKYNEKKKINYRFDLQDVVTVDGEILVSLNVSGDKFNKNIAIGYKGNKVRLVPADQAKDIAQKSFC